MDKTTCVIDGCDKARKNGTAEMCAMHDGRVRRHGDPHVALRIRGDNLTRFWSKVDRRGDDECWPWLGAVLVSGYGQVWMDGKKRQAHRVAYELLVGPIAEGYTIDHVRAWGCTRTDCVNPAHLEPVTTAVNNARSNCISTQNRDKTLCKRGHEFDRIRIGRDGKPWRICRTCTREWKQEYRRRKREQAA